MYTFLYIRNYLYMLFLRNIGFLICIGSTFLIKYKKLAFTCIKCYFLIICISFTYIQHPLNQKQMDITNSDHLHSHKHPYVQIHFLFYMQRFSVNFVGTLGNIFNTSFLQQTFFLRQFVILIIVCNMLDTAEELYCK